MFSMADLNERNMVLKAKINGKPVKTDHKQNGGGKKADKNSFSAGSGGDSFHQQIIMDKLTHAIADKIKSSVSGNGSANAGVKSSGSSGSKVHGSSANKNCEQFFILVVKKCNWSLGRS